MLDNGVIDVQHLPGTCLHALLLELCCCCVDQLAICADLLICSLPASPLLPYGSEHVDFGVSKLLHGICVRGDDVCGAISIHLGIYLLLGPKTLLLINVSNQDWA